MKCQNGLNKEDFNVRFIANGESKTRSIVVDLGEIVNVDDDVLVACLFADLEGDIVGQVKFGRVSAPREQNGLRALAHQTLAVPRVLRRRRLLAAECEHVVRDIGCCQRLNVCYLIKFNIFNTAFNTFWRLILSFYIREI